jgi:hypothetical protein
MSDDSMWIERAQTAEAQLGTSQKGVERLKKKLRYVMDTFGAREQSDGSFDIDYAKFVELLGPEKSLEVREIIDETYRIRGAVGEKPEVLLVPDVLEKPVSEPPALKPIVESSVAGDSSPVLPSFDPVLALLQKMDERMSYLEARLPS